MVLSKNESLVLEAVRNLLAGDELGLVNHKQPETSHFFWFQWEGIDDLFALKVADSPFSDSLTAAFYQTHSYKYLNDPTFNVSFMKDLTARGIPKIEIEKGIEAVNDVKEEVLKMAGEADAGWNPAMDEIRDLTTNADDRDISPSKPFTGGGPNPEDNIS